jgi:hypothetical protein
LRRSIVFLCMCVGVGSQAQSAPLPDAPVPQVSFAGFTSSDGAADSAWPGSFTDVLQPQEAEQEKAEQKTGGGQDTAPLELQQPKRILGFMPNFRSVSGGVAPHPLGWKYSFGVATHQAFDYSSFIFLGITSITAEATDSHPALGKGVGGFYAYTWRGFVDKTDGTYLSAWLLPSLLHEDTRYYALGTGHSIPMRALYVISREAVARTYGGNQTPNIAGLGGKVLTQVISRYYYPASATTFTVLASKFGYSVMRDVAFASIREFYPDVAAHYIRRHRAKMARQAAQKDSATP